MRGQRDCKRHCKGGQTWCDNIQHVSPSSPTLTAYMSSLNVETFAACRFTLQELVKVAALLELNGEVRAGIINSFCFESASPYFLVAPHSSQALENRSAIRHASGHDHSPALCRCHATGSSRTQLRPSLPPSPVARACCSGGAPCTFRGAADSCRRVGRRRADVRQALVVHPPRWLSG